MTAEGVEDLDVSIDLKGIAEDGDLFHAAADFCPEGVLGAITDKKDRVFCILDIVAEVMENPPGFAHARGRNNDRGFVEIIERF